MADDDSARQSEPDGEAVASDVEVLRSGREEARVVLDSQLQVLTELQTKAMKTVRTTVLVLGLVLSATTLPGAKRFVNWLVVSGVGSLVVGIILGLGTCSGSNPEVGIGTPYLRTVRRTSYDESKWLDVLLGGYESWIEGMEDLNETNARLLVYTQMFVGIGVVLLAIGFVVGVVFG